MKTIKEMLSEENHNITLFFKQGYGRMVNIAKAEIFANVPKNTITNIVCGLRPLGYKHANAVCTTLANVGYVPIFDWEVGRIG